MSGPSAEQAEQAAAPLLVAGSLADERVYGDDPLKPIQVLLEASCVLKRLGLGLGLGLRLELGLWPLHFWQAHA